MLYIESIAIGKIKY